MFVILRFPHNEGCVTAVITGPEFDSGSLLVDAYEVDATLKSVATMAEVNLALADMDGVPSTEGFETVPGGLLYVEEDY